MDRLAVVCVGYNRYDGLLRLLQSVQKADYKNDKVDLIISLDKGENQDSLVKLAESVQWPYGDKRIRAYDKRQGLRPHILACGELTNEYKAVIVLEDDLIVSPEFYKYAEAAVNFYDDDDRIAGISLYRHYTQVDCYRPFIPEEDGNSVFLMQFAQSWGECWTGKMWNKFYEWYKQNENNKIDGTDLPDCVKRWNEHSWMKYFMCYIVRMNRFFVYPRISLTTCFADAGQHGKTGSNDYQVPILEKETEYNFADFESAIKYDVFFERLGLNLSSLQGRNVCIDLYGTKKAFDGYDFLVSTAAHPYRIIDSYMLRYRPQEKNLVDPVKGSDIFVYDLSNYGRAPKANTVGLVKYDIKAVNWKNIFRFGIKEFFKAIMRKIRR